LYYFDLFQFSKVRAYLCISLRNNDFLVSEWSEWKFNEAAKLFSAVQDRTTTLRLCVWVTMVVVLWLESLGSFQLQTITTASGP